jgi:hypothetical protein
MSEPGTKLKDRISNGEATDHDILIELYNDVKWIKKIIGDHFRQHWAITMAVVGATMAAIVALFTSCLR